MAGVQAAVEVKWPSISRVMEVIMERGLQNRRGQGKSPHPPNKRKKINEYIIKHK